MLLWVPGVAGGSATHADAVGPAAVWGDVGSLERATADCTRRWGRDMVYTRGMRVDVQRLRELDFLPADLRLALVEGHRYRWLSQWPVRCHTPNYWSCEDNIEHAAPEFDRLIDIGLVEGPLDYVPSTRHD